MGDIKSPTAAHIDSSSNFVERNGEMSEGFMTPQKTKLPVMGWILCPPKHMLRLYLPVSQNVTCTNLWCRPGAWIHAFMGCLSMAWGDWAKTVNSMLPASLACSSHSFQPSCICHRLHPIGPDWERLAPPQRHLPAVSPLSGAYPEGSEGQGGTWLVLWVSGGTSLAAWDLDPYCWHSHQLSGVTWQLHFYHFSLLSM